MYAKTCNFTYVSKHATFTNVLKLFSVLDKLPNVCKHKKTILSYSMGQKLSSKLLFVSSQNIDGFCRFFTIRPSKQFCNLKNYDIPHQITNFHRIV